MPDLAYCDSAYIDCEGRPNGRSISDDLFMHHGRDPLRYIFQNTVSGHAALLRRELLVDTLPFPPKLFHDWWLAIRAAAGRGVVYVDVPMVRFRRHIQACSALGKQGDAPVDRGREARRRERLATAKNRKWIAERAYVARQYAAMPWKGSAGAAEWARIFDDMLAGGNPAIWRTIWRQRASVPPWSGWAPWNAVKFYFRCRRKLRRARLEGEPPAPIFQQ